VAWGGWNGACCGISHVDPAHWKKICCPIDFSHPSHDALRVAVDLSRVSDADLYLLHVFQVPAYSFYGSTVFPAAGMVERLVERIDSLLEQWREEAQRLGAPRVHASRTEGMPHVEITSFANQEDCDLIVIGTHGHTGLKHVLIGSVAEKVVRAADCAVLSVHPTPTGATEAR